MVRHVFRDREEAGARLGAALAGRCFDHPVVLGLPRGGVPVAAEVARALRAPLDVIVVRKLGVPFQPELAMGAIGEDSALVLNRDILAMAKVTDDELARVEAHERAELDRRVGRLRSVRVREPLGGCTALLVDDGIATGATMRAAVAVARAHGASRVVVAAPVAPPDVVAVLAAEADEVVVLEQPDPFWAVGSWYRHFEAVTDDEVVTLLREALHDPARSESPPADRSGGPVERVIEIPAGTVTLEGDLTVPAGAVGLVVFAHGSGSSRHSPRNRWVAARLQEAGLGTLLMDLLTPHEAQDRDRVFDIPLLAERLGAAVDVVTTLPETAGLPVGLFGASTGAGAALWAAAEPASPVTAVVCRGGRPDLAEERLADVRAPVLLVVGGEDRLVMQLNRRAAELLTAPHEVVVIAGATHLFEEPGALAQVAQRAAAWFIAHDGRPR